MPQYQQSSIFGHFLSLYLIIPKLDLLLHVVFGALDVAYFLIVIFAQCFQFTFL